MNIKQPFVLVTTPIYAPLKGGASTYFTSLVDDLDSKVNFIILTTYIKKEPIIESKNNSIILRTIPNILLFPVPLRYFIIPLIVFNICIISLVYKPKLIHAHSSASFGFSAGLASMLLGIKIIKDVQDMGIIGFNLRLGNVVKYIATGTTVKNRLLLCNVSKDNILTFPALNPIECKNIYRKLEHKEVSLVQNKFKILFVGTLSRSVKGLDILIFAFKKVNETLSNAELTIVGDGPDKKWCDSQIKRMNLEERIQMKGSLSYEETLKNINECNVLVLPSRSEANPRVILEAFQFGKPVIATNVGGVSDIVTNEKTGLLIEGNNPEKLAQAILRLESDKNLQKRLCKNGQQFVESLPNCTELHNKILEIYQQYF